MTATTWLVWVLLPAMGLTYGVVASEALPVVAVRQALRRRLPRSLGALSSCLMCTACWCGALCAAAVELDLLRHAAVRVVLLGLSVTGVVWVTTAATRGLLRISEALDRVGHAVCYRAPPVASLGPEDLARLVEESMAEVRGTERPPPVIPPPSSPPETAPRVRPWEIRLDNGEIVRGKEHS